MAASDLDDLEVLSPADRAAVDTDDLRAPGDLAIPRWRGPDARHPAFFVVVGFFGEFFYTGGEWRAEPTDAGSYLRIEVHDSDIATVDFRPAHGASGRFFLGCAPQVYFEDDDASAPVATAAEAAAFRQWLLEVTGLEVDAARIESLMASSDPDDESADAFVEVTVQRLLALAGLPSPEDLPG